MQEPQWDLEHRAVFERPLLVHTQSFFQTTNKRKIYHWQYKIAIMIKDLEFYYSFKIKIYCIFLKNNSSTALKWNFEKKFKITP